MLSRNFNYCLLIFVNKLLFCLIRTFISNVRTITTAYNTLMNRLLLSFFSTKANCSSRKQQFYMVSRPGSEKIISQYYLLLSIGPKRVCPPTDEGVSPTVAAKEVQYPRRRRCSPPPTHNRGCFAIQHRRQCAPPLSTEGASPLAIEDGVRPLHADESVNPHN